LSYALAKAPARKRIPWRGRPRVADPKGKLIMMRCTAQDHEYIAETASQAGLSTGAFLRALALGSAGPRAVKRPHAEREQLGRILGLLGKLGSNHNQIAKWSNTVKSLPDPQVLARMSEDIALMRAAVMKALDRGD
jgi:hypothetical protein